MPETMNTTAELNWGAGDVPIATRFDDPYYSLHDGAAEAAHVFLAGNDLPQRFAAGFHIAELGFGTGLNALVAGHAWAAAGQSGKLRFTSFEAFAITADEMARALAPWPQFADEAARIVAAWGTGARQFETAHLALEVIEGDARQTVPNWAGQADAWFLDGFSPAKNPELWEARLLAAVAAHTRKGGSFATYSAAGQVRRDLEAAGFTVERRAGFAHKRHMSVGRL